MQAYLDLVDLPKQRIEKRKCDHQFWLSEPTYLDRYSSIYGALVYYFLYNLFGFSKMDDLLCCGMD